MNELWQHIRTVQDFPKSGIRFFDISPLLLKPDLLTDALLGTLPKDVLASTDAFACIESRGFILGGLLSARTNIPLLLIRKAGKLPPPTIAHHYDLEYGHDTLEMNADNHPKRVLIIDDVLATGGTLGAGVTLCQKVGHHVVGALVLIDMTMLHGTMNVPIYHTLTA